MSRIEKQIEDWIGSVDRPIGVGEATATGTSSRGAPSWLPVPVAVAVVVVLLAGVAAALAGGGGGGEARVDTVTADESTTTTTPSTSTSTSTTSPSTTTVPTSSPPTVPPSSPAIVGPLEPIAPAPCPDLRSESTWQSTGDASELVAPAGGAARYVEVVANEGDASCMLEGNRCGSTAQLLHPDGTPVGFPFLMGCAGFSEQFELAPGASAPSNLSASLHAPPGRYIVRVGRFDGTEARLPIRLEEGHPACPAGGMRFSGNGTPVTVDSHGVATLLEPMAADCTVRIDEVRLVLEPDGAAHTYANGSDHWLLSEGGVFTLQTLLGPIAEPPGTYPAEVSMLLATGDRISFRSDVVVR